jgi:hypothetical protein
MGGEDDDLRVFSEIKELLRSNAYGKPTTFDDLLQAMGKPAFQREGQVNLQDFRAVVAAAGGRSRFSDHEIKNVFRNHSVEPPKQGA